MKLIDSHAHIQEDLFPSGIDAVIARAKQAGIIAIINIGTSLRESQEMLDLSVKYPNYLFPTVGLHPYDAQDEIAFTSTNELQKTLSTLASHQHVVAIGECGLDYGKDPNLVTKKEKERQETIFRMQIEVAQQKQLPLVIHCRNAWEDTFTILDECKNLVVILHSFTGDKAVAEHAIKHDYYISFSGIVTFANAQDLQSAAIIVPLDKILIETDSPYLSPEPKRGQQNEPKNIVHIVQFLAKIRNMPGFYLGTKTVENTKKVFNLPL